jgi:citrate lyase subunit beta/citryl-CoA lyase
VTVARSLLFVPATSESKIDRAFAAGADGVIIDLEDAVAASQKEAARQALAAIFAVPRANACVRVNAASTPHCLGDLLALPLPALSTVVLPKVESAAEIDIVDWTLGQREASHGLAAGSVALLALIETAKGLREVDAIARAAPRLRRLAFGAVDFANDLGTAVEEDSVVSAVRLALACASRAAGLEPPIDAPQLAIHDDDRLRAAAVRAKAQGFAGKLCIHPAQIGIVNETFAPTATEVERARRIVAAFDRAEREGVAALSVDGEMVDYPVVERARRTLNLAQSLATNRKA